MKAHRLLREGLRHINDLTFDLTGDPANYPDNILSPFITSGFENVDSKDVYAAIMIPVKTLFLVCINNKDVYVRLRGDDCFYYLILSEWNSSTLASLYTPALLSKLVSLFTCARRRYLVGECSKKTTKKAAKEASTEANTNTILDARDGENVKLISAIDRFITIIDEVNSSIKTRRVYSLKAPARKHSTRPWPPSHFNKLDVAIMAEKDTRKALFGVDSTHGGNEPRYPHDQDSPLEVRKYLCWLSLTETKPDSKVVLFLAPIAFISHEKRQEWYGPTGHQSRYYATVEEFIDYAKVEFARTSVEAKQYVIGLLTPWFFDVEEVNLEAQKRGEAIPVWWKKNCFRAGMVLCLGKLRRAGLHWVYQLTLFKPENFYFTRVEEPTSRREKQGQWVAKLVDKLKDNFEVERGWVGGRPREHIEAPVARGVPADSVEVSNEFITEVMENQNMLPFTAAEHTKMEFERMEI
ncbi:hypothetical protein F5Y11DRAFT_362257 [Daldinia sp. FL1419]|nr:hypothetical protein F5Y11DRAFT_362257 [Daldinia sp. FL1419]